MAQQLKSAGDGATPGSAAQTGTSSLDQAHNVRAAEASFIGDLTKDLYDEVGGLSDLVPQLEVVLKYVRVGNEQDLEVADSLTCVAISRLATIIESLETLAIKSARHAQQMGAGHV